VTGHGQLELDRLTKSYGDVRALDGLSFTVPPGQVFGFLGPNGAGKTTAMRAIVGVAAMGSVAELSLSGPLRVSVRVAGDPDGRWAQQLGPDAAVDQVTDGTVVVRLARREDAQAVLDQARAAGPVEQFGFVRRRLSEVFRDAVRAGQEPDPASAVAASTEGARR
jgi:ABC-type uncharacterized transport system ATPase subunit